MLRLLSVQLILVNTSEVNIMIYTCPVCGKPLSLAGAALKCAEKHSFDVSRSGYVNLLLSKHVGKNVHGDDKLMVKARREFLEKGYYSPLRDSLCETVRKYFCGNTLLDAGCGEGWYTSAVAEALENVEICGFDISKIAVEYASKRDKKTHYAVASVFHMPVADQSCDMLVSLFAPYCGEEFNRVLRMDGVMIIAIPSLDHLWELKDKIYDLPYKNEVKPYDLKGFELLENRHIKYKMCIENTEDIKHLFMMTPYYYRTNPQQAARLDDLLSLEITADFELLVYKRIAINDK